MSLCGNGLNSSTKKKTWIDKILDASRPTSSILQKCETYLEREVKVVGKGEGSDL